MQKFVENANNPPIQSGAFDMFNDNNKILNSNTSENEKESETNDLNIKSLIEPY